MPTSIRKSASGAPPGGADADGAAGAAGGVRETPQSGATLQFPQYAPTASPPRTVDAGGAGGAGGAGTNTSIYTSGLSPSASSSGGVGQRARHNSNISFPTVATSSTLSAAGHDDHPGGGATRRRSSSILQHLRRESITDQNDQLAATNLNAEWVHHKGAWVIHIVLIAGLFLLYDGIPWVNAELTWTLTNVTYVIGTCIMFHYVTGVPFDFNAGAYDTLTMWEQIDDGDQYTPTKKFLLGVPIGLFLISTHFTHYDLGQFLVNLFFCMLSVLPKLPSSHRLRLVVDDEPPSPTVPNRRLSKELR